MRSKNRKIQISIYGNKSGWGLRMICLFAILLLGVVCAGAVKADKSSDTSKVDMEDDDFFDSENSAVEQTDRSDSVDAAEEPPKAPTDSIETLKAKAKKGDAEAQYNLGVCYVNGDGVPEDKGEAVKWFQKAAEQGHAMGQYNLGVCYEHGIGVPEDKEEAVKWFQKAADQGNAMGQYNLGVCYEHGFGVPEDKEEAVNWYQKAAEQGDSDAQRALGVCYLNGFGVPEDKEEAVKWFQKAAEQGLAEAQFNLGLSYFKGEGVPEDKEEAVKWFQKAAEQGFAAAQFCLGVCYMNGDGVPQDEKKAYRLFTKAADAGYIPAIESLGRDYYGDGIATLIALVLGADPSFYRSEISVSSVTANNTLAKYAAGVYGGTKEADFSMAAKWFEKRLEFPEVPSWVQSNLAICYWGLITKEAKKEEPDQKLNTERMGKALELTGTALEKKDPTAYFSAYIGFSLLLEAFPDQEEEIQAKIRRNVSELKQLADKGDPEAKEVFGRLIRFDESLRSKAAMDESGMSHLLP